MNLMTLNCVKVWRAVTFSLQYLFLRNFLVYNVLISMKKEVVQQKSYFTKTTMCRSLFYIEGADFMDKRP